MHNKKLAFDELDMISITLKLYDLYKGTDISLVQ